MTDTNGMLIVLTADQGELDLPALSLAVEATHWAGLFDPPLTVEALVLGNVENIGQRLGACGISRVYRCVFQESDFLPQAAAFNAACLARKLGVAWIFCLSSATTDLCIATLAARLEAGLISRSVGLEIDEAGQVTAWQALHDGRLYQQLFLDRQRRNVLAWEPDALGTLDPEEGLVAEVITIAPESSPLAGRVRPVERIAGDYRTLALNEAGRIVAMGRGLLPEGLALVTQTAQRLEASVGATRPVIDEGVLPFERQIGQTGVQVSPQLLLACGVSGANEFSVGITGSRTVVAINTDPRARILALADLGIVGDARQILEAFLEISRDPSEFGASQETSQKKEKIS